MAEQWLEPKTRGETDNEEIPTEEMLNWYHAHIKEFEKPRKGFSDAQKEIKEKIKREHRENRYKEFVRELHLKHPVWTVFDLPPVSGKVTGSNGKSQRISFVNFVGNQVVSSARLKTLVRSSGEVDVDHKQIDDDVKKLTTYYRGSGFFEARVGRQLEFNEKQKWLTITFVIDEGPRYKVRKVSFLGNKKIEPTACSRR